MSTNETSDTESADVKATSTATTATTAAASEVDGNAPMNVESCNKKSKRLPSFSAIFKRMNERDAAARRKNYEQDVRGSNDNEGGSSTATGGAAAAAANEHQLSPAGGATDGNDNQPKEDKQLVYAELVLKPSETTEPPLPPKSSTEYAEIVYVQKEKDEKK